MALASVPIAAETVAVLPAAVITWGAGCFAVATLIGSAASAFEKAANSAGGAAAGAGLVAAPPAGGCAFCAARKGCMVTGVFRLNVAVYGWPSFKLAWIIGMAVCTGALSVLRLRTRRPGACRYRQFQLPRRIPGPTLSRYHGRCRRLR